MAFTIEKLLHLKEFSGCKLIAGASGKNRVIECVDTMEVPNITPWIRKNELLLTTGYSIMNRMDLLMVLLDTLYRNSSAGLAIKTRFIGPIPQTVIDRANEYELPLIEVPDDAAFIPLIHSIGNCIADEQHSLLLFSLSLSKHFNAIQQSDNFFRGISESLSGYLTLPVIITDFLLIPYSTYPEEYFPEFLQDGGKTKCLHQMLTESATTAWLPGNQDIPALVVQKIHFKGVLAGYILLPTSTDNGGMELDDKEQILLNQAANALALYLSDFGMWNSQRRQQDYTLYSKLLKGGITEEGMAAHWISQYDWPSPPLSLLTFEVPKFSCHTSALDSPSFQIMWIVRSLLVNNGIPCVVVPYEDSIRCIISVQAREHLEEVLLRILSKILSDLDLNIVVAVSAPFLSYTGLETVHAEAFDALRIARKLDKRIVFAQDSTLELAILRGANIRYLRSFVANTLGVLEEYDKRNGTNLMLTLQELVNHMGVHTQTARALYLHRNTLLYRIRRIEVLTGLDLNKSQDLYKIGIALQIRMLLDGV